MTPEKKWFKRLEKLLDQMPTGFEVSFVAFAGDGCVVHLHSQGAIKALEEIECDRAKNSFSSVAIQSFVADRVIANSES